MKGGDTWERREVKLMDRGQNASTTTIKMRNQCSNLLSTDDEGITVSIHNAKVDVFKDFTTLTSATAPRSKGYGYVHCMHLTLMQLDLI